MPTYSLVIIIFLRRKGRIGRAERFCYGEHSNSEIVRCI